MAGPIFHNIQPTFSGGEFAPSLYTRVDLQKYGAALRRARNVIVHPHGGVSSRPGTRFVANAKYSFRKCRLVPFEYSTTQAYVFEFGHQYIRIYANGGQFQVGGAPVEIPTAYQEADLPLLKFAQSADVIFIVHPSYPPVMLTRVNPSLFSLTAYPFSNGPFMVGNTDSSWTMTLGATTGSTSLTSSKSLFAAGHVGALFQINHAVPGLTVTQDFTGTGTSAGILCGGTWRIDTHGNWGGTLVVEQSFDQGTTWTALRQFSSNIVAGTGDFNVNTFGTETDGPFLVRLNMTAFSGGQCNADLNTDPYEHIGVIEVTAVTDATHAACTVLTPPASPVATWDWSEGSWSTFRGFPSTLVFFEDRLCFGGTTTEPDAFWSTKTGNYFDFGTSTPLLDTDGLGFPLPSRKMNGIKNLVGLQRIVAFTAATDWSIGPPLGTAAITPSSVEVKLEGYRGSNGADPQVVGNRIVYVQPMGTVVRDTAYDYAVNGFTGDNLSILSAHLFVGYQILEIAYQQEPDSIIWCVRSDGALLSMTYVKEEEINAWTWHDTPGLYDSTQGLGYESVCCIPNPAGYNEVWVAVSRINGRTIERFASPFGSTDPRQQFYVDCGLTYDQPVAISGITKASPAVVTTSSPHGFSNGDLVDLSEIVGLTETEDDGFGNPVQICPLNFSRYKVAGVTATTFQLTDEMTGAAVDTTALTSYARLGNARKAISAVSGLDALDGATVAILGDGQVLTPQLVSGGSVSLSVPCGVVQVGLPFTSEVWTLGLELRLPDGTIQDRKYQVPVAEIEFLNSLGGWVGVDPTSATEINHESAQPLGGPTTLFTGTYTHTLGATTGRRVGVYYRQDDPLPFTILSILPRATVGG